MICEDLDDFYREVNLSIMEGRIKTKITWSRATIIKPISALVLKNECSLKLENLGYKNGKVKQLERTYLDEESLKTFFENKEQIYYFPRRKIYSGNPKPNCLLFIQYVEKRKEYIVVWITTEFICRMGADLIFINKYFPKDAKLRLVFLDGCQFIEVAPGIFELNEWELKMTENNRKYVERFKDLKQRHFQNEIENLHSWQPIALVQEAVKTRRMKE